MEKPYSQACENNKKPILDVIGNYFNDSELVLEIGSGTAQHAVYFANELKNTYWQTSDQRQYMKGINLRINEYKKYNLGRPLAIDVTQSPWAIDRCEGVFSANTSHIMSWPMVEKMFQGVGRILLPKKSFCLYGPFNFDGQYTSSSNQAFDNMLRDRDPESGLRNFEELLALAELNGLSFTKRYDLPANNCILTWQKNASV